MFTLNALVAAGLGMLALSLVLLLIPASAPGIGYNSLHSHQSRDSRRTTKSLIIRVLSFLGLPMVAIGFWADSYVRTHQSAFTGILILMIFAIAWFMEWRTGRRY